jgi:hypothetical protein
MPQVGFELTMPVFQRAKTVHILDRAPTMIDITWIIKVKLSPCLTN